MRAALRAASASPVTLYPPARPALLAEMEETLGRTLHPDLRALLELHNGQAPSPPLFDNEWLNGTSLESWCVRKEMFDAREVTEDWWDPLWVPVTDSDGNGFHHHLETGQVRYMSNVEGLERTRSIDGLAELFMLGERLVTSGEYESDSDGGVWIELKSQLPRG